MHEAKLIAGREIPVRREDRFAALRRVLTTRPLSFLMEAHNGLSSKIVEEAGFEAIWASGLSISASLGLRDSNEASWTQVLEVLEYMADAASIPILVDGDTGYGNFNSVRRLVRKLGERGIAGVCIEDKIFPKTNSFIGEAQPLADIGEFCGRIRAGKDSQTHDDFTIVARTEALISGRTMEEALERAEAYRQAGADAILIHSKQSTANEILAFAKEWADRAPLVIVPTMYYATPTEVFRNAGISAVIWANHLLRSSITAMQETAKRIQQDESLNEVEGRVVSVRDVFRIAGNAELETAERRYLPATGQTCAIVLAASRGEPGLSDEATQPKCLVDVRGRSVLQRLLDGFTGAGVRRRIVVRGFGKDKVSAPGVEFVDNDRFDETGEAFSLAQAEADLKGELIVSYGDIVVRDFILRGLLGTAGDVVLAVDVAPRTTGAERPRDLVSADRSLAEDYDEESAPRLTRMAADVSPARVDGEWIGLARFSPRGAEWLREEIALLRDEGVLEAADMPLLLSRIAAKHPVVIHPISGHWMDVDTLADLAAARNFT